LEFYFYKLLELIQFHEILVDIRTTLNLLLIRNNLVCDSKTSHPYKWYYFSFISVENRAGDMAQVVEAFLPSKCEDLSSNPSTTKTKKKKKI
jgi:hypothetical protein